MKMDWRYRRKSKHGYIIETSRDYPKATILVQDGNKYSYIDVYNKDGNDNVCSIRVDITSDLDFMRGVAEFALEYHLQGID